MSADSGGPGIETPLDELLSTLSNPIRREALRYFEKQSTEATASLQEVVDYVENRMASKSSEDLWNTLYQVHLPTLEQRGWLKFDTEHESISYHGHQEAEQLLREVCDIFRK